MAAYDEDPNFTTPLPGGPFNARYSAGSAPGSDTAGDNDGPTIGTVTIRCPWDSAQEPGDTVSVATGDTAADDGTSGPSAMIPGPVADYVSTGAGRGHADPWRRFPWQSKAGD